VDRSFAARLGSSSRVPPIGRLIRPLSFALPRGATARRLGIALAALALLGGGWLLLRNSPLVSVEHVQIAGVQGVDAGPIDAALQNAARRMSTLNVNVGALRAAVAPFRVVRDLSVTTSFPHGLRIHVVEQLPVASLSVGGAHTAVAADGVVLGSELLARLRTPLPAITLAGSPTQAGLRSGAHSPDGWVGGAHSPDSWVGRIENATVRAELSVLGVAPRVLLGWVSKVFMGREGLTVAMRGGVSIYFGDASRPHAKWLAAARVLADPSSAGATYVDVRTPERPAAGTTAAGGLEGGATPAQVGASDPTSAALANVLAEAVNGSSGVITSAAPTSGAASATAAEPPPNVAGSNPAASGASVSGVAGSGAAGAGTTGSGATGADATGLGATESGATGADATGLGATESGATDPPTTGSNPATAAEEGSPSTSG
jgi:cell division protein FtsQ